MISCEDCDCADPTALPGLAAECDCLCHDTDHCAFCGDPLKPDDPDNRVNRHGRTDCGGCVRGMRQTRGD